MEWNMAKPDKIKVTKTQMNLLLAAVEFGYRAGEKGQDNLEMTLKKVGELYEAETQQAA
jgi:hypothetical protein